jgi:hypothetical protein
MVLPIIGAVAGAGLQAAGAHQAEKATNNVLGQVLAAQQRFGAEQSQIGNIAADQLGHQAQQRDALLGAYLGQLGGGARQGAGMAQQQQYDTGVQNLLAQVLAANPNLANATQAPTAARQQQEFQTQRANPLQQLLGLGQAQQGRGLFEQQAGTELGQAQTQLARDTRNTQFDQAQESALLDQRRQAELQSLQDQLRAAQSAGGTQKLIGGILGAVSGGFAGGAA